MLNVKSAIHLLCISITIMLATSIVSCWAGKPASHQERELTSSSNAAWDHIKIAKSNLRDDMKKRLSKISFLSMAKQSFNISKKLLAHPAYLNSTRVSVYVSMDTEVHTDDIIKDIFRVGKLCFIPKYHKKIMAMIYLDSIDEIKALPDNEWNLFQPGDDDPERDALNTGGLDLIIVPGLAFSKDGRRLGRGVGFYDKCIAAYKDKYPHSNMVTIGLAFKEQMCEFIPTEKHDIRLDYVLTV